MKKGILAIGIILCFSLAVFAEPQAFVRPPTITSPQWVAAKWLALVDSGLYAACWNQTTKSFQSRISKARWVEGMKRMRLEWGAVLSRKLKDEKNAAQRHGPQWAEKATVRFAVQLRIAGPATETVTMVWDNEAGWRVSGYDVWPRKFARFLPLE